MQDIPPKMSKLSEDVEARFNFDEQAIRKSFVRKVYAILLCQLLITMGFIALFVFHRPTQVWAYSNPWLMWVGFPVTFILIMVMACCAEVRRKTPMNFIFLGIFTAVEGFMLGFISGLYKTDAVMMAVGITAAIVLVLTLFAFQTKWDFTTMGGVLLTLLTGLIVFGFIAIILNHDILRLALASLGAVLFSFYLVYDTQLMLGRKHKYSISPEEYIFAALNLYLDIINMFLRILYITQ